MTVAFSKREEDLGYANKQYQDLKAALHYTMIILSVGDETLRGYASEQ